MTRRRPFASRFHRALGSSRARPPASGRRPRRRLAAGDRPYILALLGLVMVVFVMAIGPLQSFTAAADRVDALRQQRDSLSEEVDRLTERRRRLKDPEELELLAREQLGLVKPGEIPFVVVTPDEGDSERLRRDGRAGQASAVPWYRRLGQAIAELLG